MKTKALIIGGGIAGLALGLKLAKNSIDIVIIDPQKPQKYDWERHGGRTAAVIGQSIDFLDSIDVWETIKDTTAPLNQMKIVDDSQDNEKPVEIDFHASEIDEKNFGHNVPNVCLHYLLYEALKKQKACRFIKGKLKDFENTGHGVKATLENGKKIEAELLIGADGKFSKTRVLANISHEEKDYNQIAITCLLKHEKPHGYVSIEHHRPGGPFTLVPMPDKKGKHYSSLVWVEKTKDAKAYLECDDDQINRILIEKTRNIFGKVQIVSELESWPLKAILASRLTAPRVALAAEAAHAMSPIGAQGLNLSLRDADVLSELLINAHNLGQDIGSATVLEQYEKNRKFDIRARFTGVDSLNRLVANDILALKKARRLGLKTLNTIPFMKETIMRFGLKPAA
ncbi:MAG: FAD-dependent monooxygenase [Pseudomonadota bacterium]